MKERKEDTIPGSRCGSGSRMQNISGTDISPNHSSMIICGTNCEGRGVMCRRTVMPENYGQVSTLTLSGDLNEKNGHLE